MNMNYPSLPPEPVDDMRDWIIPVPLELYDTGILKVPIREINQCTYILTDHICGLHFAANRIFIQTSVPCQGALSHIAFIVPSNQKAKIIDFILRVIRFNKHMKELD